MTLACDCVPCRPTGRALSWWFSGSDCVCVRGVEDDVVFGAFAAAWNAMTVSAGLLIDAQADVNAVDSYGRTPLHFCARMGLTPMAEKLVSMGAHVNARNQLGSSALHYAAMDGHTATCQKLLKLGADVGSINDAGSSARALAEKRDHTKTIGYLKHAENKRLGQC